MEKHKILFPELRLILVPMLARNDLALPAVLPTLLRPLSAPEYGQLECLEVDVHILVADGP